MCNYLKIQYGLLQFKDELLTVYPKFDAKDEKREFLLFLVMGCSVWMIYAGSVYKDNALLISGSLLLFSALGFIVKELVKEHNSNKVKYSIIPIWQIRSVAFETRWRQMIAIAIFLNNNKVRKYKCRRLDLENSEFIFFLNEHKVPLKAFEDLVKKVNL